MGLSISTGALADLLANDPEGAEWLQEDLAAMNTVLRQAGLPEHHEPDDVEPPPSRASLVGMPYSFLHHLRRVCAHRLADPRWTATPLPADADPMDLPEVETELERLRSHIICHSDAEGFYVPIDFETVLLDEDGELPGGMLGSTQRLMQELIDVAPALGITLKDGHLSDSEAARIDKIACSGGGLHREHAAWLALHEAAAASLATKSVIVFS